MNDRPHFRSSPRPHVSCKVTMYRDEWSSDSPVVSYTRDLGAGGLFAVTTEKFELGDRVEVVLSTPSTWEPLILKAEICRVEEPGEGEPGGVGLRFMDTTDAQLVALTEFIESLDFD